MFNVLKSSFILKQRPITAAYSTWWTLFSLRLHPCVYFNAPTFDMLLDWLEINLWLMVVVQCLRPCSQAGYTVASRVVLQTYRPGLHLIGWGHIINTHTHTHAHAAITTVSQLQVLMLPANWLLIILSIVSYFFSLLSQPFVNMASMALWLPTPSITFVTTSSLLNKNFADITITVKALTNAVSATQPSRILIHTHTDQVK